MPKKKNNDDISIEAFLNSPSVRAYKKYEHRLQNSKGSLKVKNYFLDLIKKESFQKEIKLFRKRYGIPENGFDEPTEDDMWDGALPPYPAEWAYADKGIDSYISYLNEEGKLSKKFNIPAGNGDLLGDYIFYNKLLPNPEISGLFMVQDGFDIGKHKEVDEENNKDFPILLRISPYAGLRDLLNYVNIVYTRQIKPLQKKYKNNKIKLGKIRSKNEIIQERNAYIYKKRNLPYKEISTLVSKKFTGYSDSIDEGSIGKIISLENKKRKEV